MQGNGLELEISGRYRQAVELARADARHLRRLAFADATPAETRGHFGRIVNSLVSLIL